MRAALGLSLLLALAAGCKGDRQKCEQATRNFATLTYWKKHDPLIAAVPEGERDALRRKKLTELANGLENDIDFFVQQCVSANNDEQVDCMIAARTGDDAAKCADLAKPD